MDAIATATSNASVLDKHCRGKLQKNDTHPTASKYQTYINLVDCPSPQGSIDELLSLSESECIIAGDSGLHEDIGGGLEESKG